MGEYRSILAVIAYSPDYSSAVVAENPEVRFFPERGMHQLGILRQREVDVAFVGWEHVGEIEVASIARLCGVRSWKNRFFQLTVGYSGSGSLIDDLFADVTSYLKLEELAANYECVRVYSFAPSESLNSLVKALGAHDTAGSSRVWDGSKSWGRSILLQSGVPVPASDGQLHYTWQTVARAAAKLFEGASCDAVYVKVDPASFGGGVGVRRLTSQEISSHPPPGFREYERLVNRHGAIVESEVPAVRGSIGQLARITPTNIQTSAVYTQLMSGSKFLGGVYDTARRDTSTTQMTRAVGTQLMQLGYFGDYGVDYVETTKGSVAVEINLRKVGSMHSLAYASYLRGLSSEVLFREASTDERFVAAYRSFRNLHHLRPDLRAVESRIRRAESDISIGSKSFLSLRGAYERFGVIDAVVVAPSQKEAWAHLAVVERSLEVQSDTSPK